MNRSLFDLTALPQLWLLQSVPAQIHFPAESKQKERRLRLLRRAGALQPPRPAAAAQAASEPEVEHT